MNPGTYHQCDDVPIASAGYLSESYTRNAMTRNDRGATIFRTGTPNHFILAGDAWYSSGRRLGKKNAAKQTIQMHTTPASTPSASQVANEVPFTDQISMPVTMIMTVRMAGTGE